MQRTSLRLSFAFLILSALPLGCTSSSSPPPSGSGGAGGSSQGGGTGGATKASGGSGGNSSASGGGGTSATAVGGTSGSTGGAGSGGAATGGAGGSGTGGTSSRDGGTGGNPSDQDGGGDTVTSNDDSGGEVGGGISCTDSTTNGDETDTDCGGSTCPKCGAGQSCKVDGDCLGGSCASGKCADPFAATATVTNNNGSNMWTITLGTVVLAVDASSTGMVSSLTIDGTDIVVKNSASNGSVFWTSPQSDWYTSGHWPPPTEMADGTAYTPSSKDNILTMTGPVGSTDKISISKRYWGNVDNQAITLEYTIHNTNSTAVSNAPWEITRVYPGGLSFFPNGDDWIKQGDASFSILPVTTSQGAVWFNDNAASYTSNVKGGADGLEGWAAHIVCGTGLQKTCASGAMSPILIKQWTDTPASDETVNPTEREVEIYVDQSNTYEEFEQQGLYQSIPAGGTLVWTMHWLLRYLPSTVAPTPGSADLMTWVRGQLL